MHRAGRILCLLCAAALSGCAETAAVRPSEWVKNFRAAQNLYTENVARIDIALIEVRPGDPFINKELWCYTDEQIVDMERRLLLERNGFRVGQLVGMPPAKFQQLLTNERSCLNARTQFLGSGQFTRCDLGGEREETRFSIQADGQKTSVEFERAKLQLEISAALVRQGKTKLRFLPRVEHGEAVQQIRPAADLNGLVMLVERPSKAFPELTWEVSLSPNEYLVIGALAPADDNFAAQAFVRDDERPAVQRLLVIRTSRTAPSDDLQPASLEDFARAQTAMPLALQATLTSARAVSP